MGAFVPNSATPWVLLVSVVVLALLAEIPLHKFKIKLLVRILENCEPLNLKDAAKNVWTNVGVTSALILTVVASMLQTKLEPRFETNNDTAEILKYVDLIYSALCYMAVWHCSQGVITCLINLVVVEPLSSSDAIKYFIANPNTLGTPTIHTSKGVVFMLLAYSLWALGTFGLTMAIFTSAWFLAFLAITVRYISDKVMFNPKPGAPESAEWQWPLLTPSEWPHSARSHDERTKEIFRTLAEKIDFGPLADQV